MKLLFFLVVLSVLTTSTFSLQCYVGVSVTSASVNDVPVSNRNASCSCSGNSTCPVCGKLEISTATQNIFVQGCFVKEYCNKIVNSRQIADMVVYHRVNVSQYTEFSPVTLDCCDTDFCNRNGNGLLKGEIFVVFICIIFVNLVF